MFAPGLAAASPAQFVALEEQLSAALAAYDTAAVDALWDDKLVFVFPNGRISHKADRLAAMSRPRPPGGPALTSHNDSVDVQYEDANMAVVTVRSAWRAKPTDPGDPYMATHVWIRRGERWRLIAAQVAQITN